MKTIANIINAIVLAAVMMMASCAGSKSEININRQSDSLAVIEVLNPQQLLLLPIQEDAPEAQMRLNTGSAADTWQYRASTIMCHLRLPTAAAQWLKP